MSRIAKAPVNLPKGVEVQINQQQVFVKGTKGQLSWAVPDFIEVSQDGDQLVVQQREGGDGNLAMAGTARALVQNMVTGVHSGFERRLQLVGVGYRAKVSGSIVNLTLGFSHPVDYQLPEGVSAETPSQTEIVLTGVDKQKVGQVAAEIRGLRPPEPYKGKGVRYSDEQVRRKEAKKK
ncbi:MAG: 50S ribosomal protein L6 [Pseudomonadota bacterium]|nr:50S ribosomal protein L6 [Pseudomonadota bacterium]